MNYKHMKIIAQKDIFSVIRNKAASVSMIILPLIFAIVMPTAMIMAIQSSPDAAQALTGDPDIQSFLTHLPSSAQAAMSSMDENQSAIYLLLGMMMAPMFLIFPLMYASIIAAESFAGEFERKTLEALLYTPASDEDLFFGKVIAAFVPAVVITWASFLVYAIILNGLAYPLFQRIWFPIDSWWPLIFWVSPAISLMSVAVTVLISAKVKNFMGTYQISGSLVLIVVGLFVGQMAGVVYLSVGFGLIIGLICWIIAAVILTIAVKSFHRQKLLLKVI